MADPHAALNELRVRRARALVDAMHRTGEDLLGKAQRLAPLEEGTLRGSALLVLIVNGDRYEGAGGKAAALAAVATLAKTGATISVEAEVSFNTPYAARQHEELDWQHTDGQAQYLAEPLAANADRYSRIHRLAVDAASRGTI